ncbi:MAG: TonB-dependent receptor [Hyphomonadaceae bacterium]|nr:TonB-dependent receptor [Hyphomonadaceae bacterium]
MAFARTTFALTRTLVLLAGASTLNLASIMTATAQDAAQDRTASEQSDNAITVTGTRIRGVAPVGSSLIQVDREELVRSGQTSTADILYNVPSVLSLGTGELRSGGASQQGNDLTALVFNKSANLRGLGPGATLNLVNGHRAPHEGATMSAFDGDNIPAQLLQRVEIVADGTSPIYGADAVAGTVNFIMRAPETAFEVYGQYGWTDGRTSYQGTLVGGYNWGSGGVIAAYQRTHFDRLSALDRPHLYSDDFSPFGGAPPSDLSVPGNIVVNGVNYAIPRGQNGTALTLAQLGAAGSTNRANSWVGYDAAPESDRDTFAVNFRQNITDWLELFADGFSSDRDFDMNYISQGTKVTVVVPNSNFYSPCNHSLTGAPAALITACGTGALTVKYNTLYDSGPGRRSGYDKGWNVTGGVRIDLPLEWEATVSYGVGQHDENAITRYFLGNGLPSFPELAGATAATAFNVFCDASQFACNPASMTSRISGVDLNTLTVDRIEDTQVNLDGPLFSLPGGEVKLAVGVERYYEAFINTNNFGSTPSKRHVESYYGELFVPIVGEGNRVPLIYSLDLNVAGRVDDYDDVGETRNPKYGINWSPTQDLRMHASYGTSFRAPGLIDNNPFAQHGYIPFGPYPGNVVTASLCGGCAAKPGLAFYSALGGAAGDLQPEESESYSIGGDWAPEGIPGLTLSANYWNIEYTGQVGTPVYNAGPFQAVNQQYYNQYIVYNPTLFPQFAANNPVAFFGAFPTVNLQNAACAAVYGQKVTTQAQFNNLIACVNSGGDGGLFGPPFDPSNVAAVESGHRINGGSTKADGWDLSAEYQWDSSWGHMRVGGIAEYITAWDVAPVAGAPSTDQNNQFGYPPQFKFRGNVGWSDDVGPGDLSANVFLNYTNSYHIDASLLPGAVGAQYTEIESYTTTDLSLIYEFGDQAGLASNVQIAFSVQNVFDDQPPLVLNASGVGGILFDPSNASPLQRVFQLQVGKKF